MRNGAKRQTDDRWRGTGNILLELILSQHEHLGVAPEALDGSQIRGALVAVLWRGHDLEHVERGPRHVVAEHLEVGELHESRGLEVHVVCADFLAAFFYRVGDVFLLGALVCPQAPDEVVEGFFEPGDSLDTDSA